MTSGWYLAFGVCAGAAIGLPFKRYQSPPVLASITAMLVSWMFTSFAGGLMWMMSAASGGAVAALSFGMSEMLLVTIPIAGLGAGLHALLGKFDGRLGSLVMRNRVVILGGIGGLCGALVSGPFGSFPSPLR